MGIPVGTKKLKPVGASFLVFDVAQPFPKPSAS
jgi:hypothetical protein